MGSTGTTPGLGATSSGLDSIDNNTSVPSSAIIGSQSSGQTSDPTSSATSPVESRDPSPTKYYGRMNRAMSPVLSRKNSAQDPSPPRKRSSIATPAVLRQISASAIPCFPPPSGADTATRSLGPQKLSTFALDSTKDSHRWPTSPRLKSPPPSFSRPTVASSARRGEATELPIINVQRATPSPQVEPNSQVPEMEYEESHLMSGLRSPGRGPSSGSSTLETVHEVSQPNTPRLGLDTAIMNLEEGITSDSSARDRSPDTTSSSVISLQTESGSDSGSIKTYKKRTNSTPLQPPLLSRQSSTGLRFGGRGQRSGESSSRNMTVETEEVKDMPQMSLIPIVGGQRVNGTLRTRPSNETIKPKREKKKHPRKTTSIASGNGEPPRLIPAPKHRHSWSTKSISPASCRSPAKFRGQGSRDDETKSSPGRRVKRPALILTGSITSHVAYLLTRGLRPASSKADIFEAKLASAVQEANSCDSDETFVYESNPPDAERPRRYHSRTPSVTSMASQIDRNGMRPLHSENGAPIVHVKKSRKFVNTYTANGNESLQGEDDGRGTSRSNIGSGRGTTRYHHHHGHWGRNNGNGHPSIFDNESPFPTSGRSVFSGHNSRPPSNPPSPQSTNFSRSWLPGSKRHLALSNGYNMSDTTPLGSERTPLLDAGTIRTPRGYRNRRHTTLRNLESQTYHRNTSILNRCASCLVLIVMLLLVVTGAIGFMFATSQPLTEVALLKIGNVLASEQELMFDLTVQAQNPNVVVVMIDSADIEVFAKSPHAGNDSEWWRHPEGEDFKILDDPQNDPPELGEPSDEDSSPNMRLGNIHTFDSPLTYEGSFFHRGFTTSTGGLRLASPGNSTEGGAARWERIISEDFTLVIKGVLKYTLPLSHKVRKVSISGKTIVKSNAANDPALRPKEPEASISETPTAGTA